MQVHEVRLELLKVLLPIASRHSIIEPQKLVETARTLENYVLESEPPAEVTPDSAGKRGPGRPRKENPAHGGQVEPNPRVSLFQLNEVHHEF